MKRTLYSLLLLVGICFLFFWQIFKGYIPFPGDLLVNENPYRSLSIAGFPPGAYPNKAQGMDVITEMYPWRYFTISELKQGRIPFWNPHNFSGNIIMQNFQSSVFNPFNFFFFIFPFTIGWTFFILIQPILASLFFFLFARELKVSRFAAMVGSIAFAFSSYMSVWIEYGNIAATFAYLPLLLFFLHRFIEKQKIKDYFGFVIAAGVMLLSGYIQGAFYSYLIAFLFALWTIISSRIRVSKKLFLSLGGMFAFPILLTLFQTLPTLQIFSQSTRWPYSVKQIQDLLQPVWYWITLFASDFFGNPATRNYYLSITYIERVTYIGVPVLLFATIALFEKRQYKWFFVFVAIVTILLTTNIPGIAYFYKLPIPVINTTVPTRFLSIFMFASVVLATFGIDAFYKRKSFHKNIAFGFIALYTLLWIGLFSVDRLYPQYVSPIKISEHNLILPTMLIIFSLLCLVIVKKYTNLSKGLLFILVVIDLFYIFQKITPFAPLATIYPQNPVTVFLQKNARINRFWGYGSGYIPANFQTVDGTFSPEGNDPLHIKNYGDLLTSSYDGKIPLLPPRPDANLAAGYGQEGLQNKFRQKLLNLLGVKFIVQHDESRKDNDPDVATFPKDEYALAFSHNPWQIYENKNVLPRYFLANTYTVAAGQDALNKLYEGDLLKTVVLDKPLNQTISKTATGSVQLQLYTPQKIVFTTQTTAPMILFLSDAYFSSWKAKVDTKSQEILLADFAFRAIVVPQGRHTVTMYFESSAFNLGILIASVALIAFVGSCLVLHRYEKI